MNDRIAIVILNWNGAAMMRRYLPTVVKYSAGEATVYVADNASTDDSLLLLEADFPGCKVIKLDRNWGLCRGLQQGSGADRGRVLPAAELRHRGDAPLADAPAGVHGCPSRGSCVPAEAALAGRQGLFRIRGGLAAGSSTGTVTRSAVAAFSTRWSVTVASMTTARRYSGPLEPP